MMYFFGGCLVCSFWSGFRCVFVYICTCVCVNLHIPVLMCVCARERVCGTMSLCRHLLFTTHVRMNIKPVYMCIVCVCLFYIPEVESPEGGLLEELYLGSNRLTAASIPPCIPYLHNVDCCLLSLMLKDNDINDEGATALAVALAANQSLQRLWYVQLPC